MDDGTLRFELTASGVLVELFYGRTSDKDCQALLQTLKSSAGSVRKVIALVRREPGLSPAQRQELARVLSEQPISLRFALMTDSALVRGSLTALNWITGQGKETRLFKTSELERAMDFLQLLEQERVEVHDLIRQWEQEPPLGLFADSG